MFSINPNERERRGENENKQSIMYCNGTIKAAIHIKHKKVAMGKWI